MMTYSYERDPAAIYRQSFAAIRAEAGLDALPDAMRAMTIRLIHACGMPDIIDDLRFSADSASLGSQALAGGAPIFCDAQMVASGVMRARLPAENEVICTLHDPDCAGLARTHGTTRSAAAVELWDDRLAGAIVAIGNAPTALFHLLERIDAGGPKPALILGFPVGFVGAVESKDALANGAHGVPFITLLGRRGGSALAAAAVNALAAGNPEDQI